MTLRRFLLRRWWVLVLVGTAGYVWGWAVAALTLLSILLVAAVVLALAVFFL